MSLLQGFQTASWETQGYGSNEFQIAHRLRDFYGINKKAIWLFQVRGCPVAFFLTWIRVVCQEDTEVQRWYEQTWQWAVGVLC